mgnify:CR=1 FL=1|jgi:prophage tail gpP-like protein
MKAEGIALQLDGVDFDEWTSAEVSRDLKDFSGSFSFTVRDAIRSLASFDFATLGAAYLMRPGAEAKIYIDGNLVLLGYVDDVSPTIDDSQASVTISGRDKTGDLVDSAALVDGPAEVKNAKLEDAAAEIAKPFGLTVRSEIDTGEPFPRYSLDLSETAFSAIEKGARSRHALMLSDGVGGVVITRTGKTRAPADLTLPGNVRRASGKFSHKNRHSENIVRGQGEFAGKDRTAALLIEPASSPILPADRQPGDGAATALERKGTAATGRAKDDEINRYRPIVHLARSKAANVPAQDEADWRMRTARGESEEFSYTVRGHGEQGRIWRINELTNVADNYLQVFRDMLISHVTFREDESGRETDLTVTSPEAFDKDPVGSRRTNKKASNSKGLDSKAEKL